MLRGEDPTSCGVVGMASRSFPFRFDAIPFPRALIRAISSAVACRPGALSFSVCFFPRPPKTNDARSPFRQAAMLAELTVPESGFRLPPSSHPHLLTPRILAMEALR